MFYEVHSFTIGKKRKPHLPASSVWASTPWYWDRSFSFPARRWSGSRRGSTTFFGSRFVVLFRWPREGKRLSDLSLPNCPGDYRSIRSARGGFILTL